MERYIYSDLIFERENEELAAINDVSGRLISDKKSFDIFRTHVDAKSDTGLPSGDYLTFITDSLMFMTGNALNELILCLSNELRELVYKKLCNCIRSISVLIVGLGNPIITADSLGSETVKRITVSDAGSGDMKEKISVRIAAVSLGVPALTGINTYDHVSGLINAFVPDVIIAVDSLAARSSERLGRVIQLSDCGISPGSGIGNGSVTLNEETLGIPVISLGIPTVIRASTMICDMLRRGGISVLSEDICAAVNNNRSLFVSPKECDIIIKSAADILSQSINIALDDIIRSSS